ncbi:hypothetical protein R6242_07685 [Iodobacter sp. CM08]|uniref:DUF7079 family protein n=1 Tax=Iodobacter sp. CM08 TaxID=3085902 RepID=UPI0029816085|nr:hypothetical protein [Iodobacter sp. CM08]MDW5416453.1 hypothetical protein [Iodobacter sp. CM08]
MNEPSREEIWEALSDLFVDNEIDYQEIAGKVRGVDLNPLERILFEEVAPYCAPNLSVPAPSVWSGFDKAELLKGVRLIIENNSQHLFSRLKHQIYIALILEQ